MASTFHACCASSARPTIQSCSSVSAIAPVERGAIHAGVARQRPERIGDAAGAEHPAVLIGEQRVDEPLVALRRQVARHHGGLQRRLVGREIVEHPAQLPGRDPLGLDLRQRPQGEVGAVRAGEREALDRRSAAPSRCPAPRSPGWHPPAPRRPGTSRLRIVGFGGKLPCSPLNLVARGPARQAAPLHLGQQLAERVVAHLAGSLLAIDHEARSRVRSSSDPGRPAAAARSSS